MSGLNSHALSDMKGKGKSPFANIPDKIEDMSPISHSPNRTKPSENPKPKDFVIKEDEL